MDAPRDRRPWRAAGTRIYDADGREIAVATRADPGARKYAEDTAAYIVACVNGTAADGATAPGAQP